MFGVLSTFLPERLKLLQTQVGFMLPVAVNSAVDQTGCSGTLWFLRNALHNR